MESTRSDAGAASHTGTGSVHNPDRLVDFSADDVVVAAFKPER